MVQIVTDTIPNLPPALVQQLRIHLVPVYVTLGDETLRDAIDLTSAAFYERLPHYKNDLPSTSQPAVSDFVEHYQRLRYGEMPIISIHISNKLSGTVESARQAAAKLPNLDIRVVDTLSVGAGHGLMVLEAARMAQTGAGAAAILDKLDEMRERTRLYMVLETLEYLELGGRIGRAARMLGTLLDMKPVLTLKNGAIESHDRYRSWTKALEVVKSMLREDCYGRQGVLIGVNHAASTQQAQALAAELSGQIKPDDLLLTEIGPALGVHVGPGAVGLAWYVPHP